MAYRSCVIQPLLILWSHLKPSTHVTLSPLPHWPLLVPQAHQALPPTSGPKQAALWAWKASVFPQLMLKARFSDAGPGQPLQHP